VSASQAENPAPGRESGVLDRALALVEFLRAHCPWDAAQTPVSLTRYLLEEAHEVAGAIAGGDADALRGELGDLLLNVAFQVVIGEETGAFSREEVVAGLEQKMRRRHPHLYGLGEAEPWEAIKARERAGSPAPASILDEVPSGLDPLLLAFRIQERVARVGFDWDDARGAWDKVREETEEIGRELDEADPDRLQDEIGDLLFAAVNLARLAKVHPSAALARANAKFSRRFRGVETLAAERGVVWGRATLAELDLLWDEVKRIERASSASDGESGGSASSGSTSESASASPGSASSGSASAGSASSESASAGSASAGSASAGSASAGSASAGSASAGSASAGSASAGSASAGSASAGSASAGSASSGSASAGSASTESESSGTSSADRDGTR
jgi:MazG family protein